MFVDRITVHCRGGDGGSGCLSFRREAHVPRGGPDGGDGGDGGNVVVKAAVNVGSLTNIVGHKHWNAERGEHGKGALRTGRRGEDIVIYVPPGTLVIDEEHGQVIRDLAHDGDSIVVARGGKGGYGNKHFATATNQAPREYEDGTPGSERTITLELKLIADVGLIGKPNAGKSTLLSRLSRAHPEIADYPFTTKYPNLGLVRIGYDRQFVMADIPGLIEGAHAGLGLGHEFLKHVERTKVLVHLVEPQPVDGTDPIENYRAIRQELHLYDESLSERPEIVAVTKSELPDAETVADLITEEFGSPVLLISAVTGKGLRELVDLVFVKLRELDEAAATGAG
ncbi:MAG: GTPase ObgE [Planctomycetaceae bacterium]